ncbi:MAG: EAL domain-containing protein [Pseudomonadales bacterium]|nr:EAL domain-containing protein [Pseudomonadales bacterium]MDG1441363.1 EAL domain-containing protein [Pseudomonadales bacterium]
MPSSILVVEDEVLVARDIKSRLIRMGYEVLDTAKKGSEAIDKSLALKPDLILMDIHLADEIDGIEAAVRIRQTMEVPVIFCTAYADEETLERAKISTPYGYVLKPFDNRELEINIEIALYKHNIEIDLNNTRKRLDATLTSISDGVIATDLDGQICLINPMAERITGWCQHTAMNQNLGRVMPLQAFEGAGRVVDTENIASEEPISELRQVMLATNDQQVPIEVSTNVIKSASEELVVITFRDISKQIHYEQKIRHSAFYDDLTELPNRALFMNRLESSINRRKRGFKESFAVVFIDLDGFSPINEGLGHEIGDKLLSEVATRIAMTVRPDDTISRFSADIFAVLLDPVDSAAGAIQACERIQRAIEKPIDLGSTTVDISATAGIVFDQELYNSAEEMVRDADTAIHRAKLDAKGTYVIFDNQMYQNALKFIERKSSMQQAMNDKVFIVHYQPIVDTDSSKLVSMEALVRWPDPQEGYISPGEFIPIAEQTGLIMPLGEFVLRSVCEQIKVWENEGFSGFRVAVNLSLRQFDTDLPSIIESIMLETGVSASSLALEITEGIASKNVEQNVRMLQALRSLGLSISIDDFGTGYSSLAYLKRFPLNTLKIDRSFIQDIDTNEDDREITKAIIAMGQNLKLKVLAEGVENLEQLEILKQSGCDYIQGFYFSKALPANEIQAFLKTNSMI